MNLMPQKLTLKFFIAITFASAVSCSKVKTVDEDGDQRLLEIYTNYPGIKPGGQKPPEFDIKLAQLIDQSKTQVYWAMYGFSRATIRDAVIRAVQRGLDVQLAGDYGTYSTGSSGYVQFEELMRRYPNAKLITGNSQSIQHNKFCVLDRRYVMTGTGNITDSEIDQNYNVWLLAESKEMANDFINEHQQMMAGLFGHSKDRVDFNNTFNVGGVKIEAYFSPYEDAMSRFLQAVGEAQSSVRFAIFAFTHDQLGRLFIQKHKEFTYLNSLDGGSRSVRGIMDRSQLTHNQYVEIYRIGTSCGHTYGFEAGSGITNGGSTNPFTATWDTNLTQTNTRCYAPFDLKIDGDENNTNIGDWQAGGGRLHAKTIVVDAGTPNAKLLMGSFNWSPNANNNNDENLIVIHSPAIVERYLQFWQGIYNDGVPLNKRYPTNQELLQGKVTYQQRDTGDYQKVVISEVNHAGSTRKISGVYYAYDANEFIELYNPNNSAVDVSYWSLYFPVIDNYTDPGLYTSGFPSYESLAKRGVVGFPGGTYIPPKGFLVVTQSDQSKDLDADGYLFPASILYDPANSATWGNSVTYYNPVNGLSDFFTLFERRSSSTGRVGLNGTVGTFYTDPFTNKQYANLGSTGPNPLTFGFPVFDAGDSSNPAGRCRAGWVSDIDRFSGSAYFNPYHMHAGASTNYPHLTSLWMELRDNRGNLVDIAGINRRNGGAAISTGVSAAPTAHSDVGYFKGGFHGLVRQSGTTANGSASITGLTNATTTLVVGMTVVCTDKATAGTIPSNAVIQTINSATQITMNVNATGVCNSKIAFLRQFDSVTDTTDSTRAGFSASSNSFPDISTTAFPLRNSSGSGENDAEFVCSSSAGAAPYMVSMERNTTYGAGTLSASWDHATLAGPRTTSIGKYIKSEYKDRTIATPGEINSRWSSLP